MHGRLDHLDLATHIIFFDMLAEIDHRGVRWVVCPKHFYSFIDLIGSIKIINYRNINAR